MNTRIGDGKNFVRVGAGDGAAEIEGGFVAKLAVQVLGGLGCEGRTSEHGCGIFEVAQVDFDGLS